MSRFRNPFFQHQDNAGRVLSNGRLYFYETGTDILKQTYSDGSETIENDLQYVELDAEGREPNIFFSGNSKVVLTDSTGDPVDTKDPVSGSDAAGQFSDYSAASIYSINEIVRASDGNYYNSKANNNTNNTPQSSPASWTQVLFLEFYNATSTYGVNDVVIYNGYLYTSQEADNTGNTPDSSAQWDNSVSPPDAGIITNRNLMIGNFRVNQLAHNSSGANIVLAAGEYGHDGFVAGDSGAIYSMTGYEANIISGSLLQVIDGRDIEKTGVHILSYSGTATSTVNTSSSGASGTTHTLTEGSPVKIEFELGTVLRPKLEFGSVATQDDNRSFDEELALCQSRIQKTYNYAVAAETVTNNGMVLENSAGANVVQHSVSFKKRMAGTPTVSIYSTHTGAVANSSLEFGLSDIGTFVENISESGFYIRPTSRLDGNRYSFHYVAKYQPSWPS